MTDEKTHEGDEDPKRRVAREIAHALGETEKGPRIQIARIINHFGVDAARAWLAQTASIEAAGGQMLPAPYNRRRTPGGVFFALVRQHMEQAGMVEELGRIFVRNPRRPRSSDGRRPEIAAAEPPFRWEDRIAIVRSFAPEDKGEATSMQSKLVVRPGKVIERGDIAITSVNLPKPPTTMPKGMPAPPAHAGDCTIYLAIKQWRKIKDAVRSQKDDKLIVEGYFVWDTELEGYALYAQSVKSVAVEAARRNEQQRAAS